MSGGHFSSYLKSLPLRDRELLELAVQKEITARNIVVTYKNLGGPISASFTPTLATLLPLKPIFSPRILGLSRLYPFSQYLLLQIFR